MVYQIILETYSDNSFVIRGSDTIKFKDTLKEFGGKWNSNLKGGAGWIFNSKFKNKIAKFLEIILEEKSNCDDKDISLSEDISLPKIEDYTDKSFILFGNTKEYKDKIKELGGKWNSRLKDGKKGWIFSSSKKKEIEEWLTSLEVDDENIIDDEDENSLIDL